jgi:hypothetical protein
MHDRCAATPNLILFVAPITQIVALQEDPFGSKLPSQQACRMSSEAICAA